MVDYLYFKVSFQCNSEEIESKETDIFCCKIGEYIVMDNVFLVQYEPLTTVVRRILSLGFEPKPTQEMIEKFYDEVNASDFYHNSIVLVVKAKSMDEVREQVIGTFNVLYGK